MKTIKVLLDFNISKKAHSLYNSFFLYPPKGVEYKKSEFRIINEKNYATIGRIYKKIVKLFPFVSRFHQKANDTLRRDDECDLIYFSMHLGETKKPFVLDYEHAYNFIDIKNPLNKQKKEEALRKFNQKNLKYLLPINNESLKSFNLFFKELRDKINQEIIYPTIFIDENLRKKVKREKIIIFIGSANISTNQAFYVKGGFETIKAFENLSKKYPDYKFMIISKIPEEIKIKERENLIIKDVLPQKELWEILNKAQIFVQPNYHAPTMAYLEAMFFSLPIITYDCWGNKEYVNKENGILIKPKEINHINEYNIPIYTPETIKKIKENSFENSKEIEKEIIKLIKNQKLMNKLGKNGLNQVLNGKFSLKRRNEKLLKIYNEALNNG